MGRDTLTEETVPTRTTSVGPKQWVERYGDSLYGYAFFRIPDKGAAEELVQETFLAALDGLDGFAGRSSEKTWLFSILKHKILDHIRRKYREQTREHRDEQDTPVEMFDERGHWLVRPGLWAQTPAAQFRQQEFAVILVRCLSRLPRMQAETFSLKEIGHHESEEICKVLGISSTNYWVLMHRARLGLRRCLEVEWFGSS